MFNSRGLVGRLRLQNPVLSNLSMLIQRRFRIGKPEPTQIHLIGTVVTRMIPGFVYCLCCYYVVIMKLVILGV